MLEVIGLERRFGDVQALAGVSFTVAAGEMVGFLGPNGAGKTTVMRAIMGVTEPDKGEVRLRGQLVTAADRRGFGYMPEERGLYPRMRIRDQLVYLARLHGLDRGWAEANADHWLARVGLSERAQTRLSELSHGNQQRVQLAAALVHEPSVLVLDEPFSGLDPVAIDTLAAILAERAAEGGVVLFSSHQLDLVEDLCRSVVMLHEGRVVLDGDVREIRRGAPRRTLRVAVVGSDGTWADSLHDTELVAKDGDVVELLVGATADAAKLMAAANRAGPVAEFCLGPPRLSDLFLDAVGA